jgi:hypothetical protein
MNYPKQLRKSEFGQKTADFLNIAYKDYLAARVLLNAHLPVQGAVLASTAVEKYFKAILAFGGNESQGHLKKAHFNAVKNFDPQLWALLSQEFVELLQRVYSLRYQDDLEKSFNVVIATREFLAELDCTAVTIQACFKLRQGEKEAVLMYHQDRKLNDPRLLFNNHVLSSIEKQTFISGEPQFVYEVRNCPLRGFMEVSYFATQQPSDGKFMRPGLMPKDNGVGMQYQMAFLPLPPNIP